MKKRLILPLLLFALTAISLSAQDAPPPGGPDRGMMGGMGAMMGDRGVHGSVTAVNGSTLTLKTEEGETYQIFTSANTRIMKERQPIKPADIHVGDILAAGGERDAKAKTVGAVFVIVFTAEQAAQAKKMRDDFGKTWTAGEVTSIQDTTINLKRMDGATQSVLVDENTSFKKHRDSITLADIQVGDRLSAQGALKDGSFVATTVNVRNPERDGEGRGPGAGQRPGGGAQPQQ